MARKILNCIVLLLLLSTEAEAATVQYSVRYLKEHLFYQNNGEMNVIDVDLEWPDMIDGDGVDSLKTFAIKWLFGFLHHDFDEAYAQFKEIFGKPVTEAFDTIPDDRKFTYIDLSLKLLGHSEGRFVSFEIKGSCKPGPAARYAPQDRSILVTYDIRNRKILLRNQLLRYEDMSKSILYNYLLMRVDMENSSRAIYVYDACLVDGGILLRVEDDEDQNVLHDVVLSDSIAGWHLKHAAKSLLNPLKKGKERELQTFDLPRQWKGEPILDKAERMPAPVRTDMSLADQIQQNLRIPDGMADSGIHGKVKLSLLVDKEGNMQDVRVIQSLEPSCDRAAVKAVKALPRWKPGMEQGQPENVRATISIIF